MRNTLLVLISLFSTSVFSHSIHYDKVVLRHWSITKEHKFVDGTFYMLKDGKVYIEQANENIVHFPLHYLSKEDQSFALKKDDLVKNLNTISQSKTEEKQSLFDPKFWIILFTLLAFGFYIYKLSDRKKTKYLYPVLFVGTIAALYSFAKKALTTTDPAFVNSAFIPFASTVSTSWDNTYFYVNSKGIPNHTMMVGISNHGWQQQVPVPQCYVGTNAWSIPLNPVIATTPVPVSATHFLKGAIAIAANGVAIFNYHTNTGVDSFLDGQLDTYGGHCGRGDDYHYHTAPMHLYTLGQTTTNLPCAFALDGFAVYGSLEPNGTAMATLDANHGHYGTNDVYHYHGTATAPYMIGNMVGQVTEDANLQIIPQAQSHPVRNENWTPLGGALITSCTVNNTNNGYNLSYTLNGVAGYATNFSWIGTVYTFVYVTPSGTTTTNYNGFAQCTVPNLGIPEIALSDTNITLYPNPATDIINIQVKNGIPTSDIQSIAIFGMKGELVSKINNYKPIIDVKNLSKGTYFVKIQFPNYLVTKKVIVK